MGWEVRPESFSSSSLSPGQSWPGILSRNIHPAAQGRGRPPHGNWKTAFPCWCTCPTSAGPSEESGGPTVRPCPQQSHGTLSGYFPTGLLSQTSPSALHPSWAMFPHGVPGHSHTCLLLKDVSPKPHISHWAETHSTSAHPTWVSLVTPPTMGFVRCFLDTVLPPWHKPSGPSSPLQWLLRNEVPPCVVAAIPAHQRSETNTFSHLMLKFLFNHACSFPGERDRSPAVSTTHLPRLSQIPLSSLKSPTGLNSASLTSNPSTHLSFLPRQPQPL